MVAPYMHPRDTGVRTTLGSRVWVKCCNIRVCAGAGERTRTADLLITNQLLYQLSYAGMCARSADLRGRQEWPPGGLCESTRSGARNGSPQPDDAGTAVGSPSLSPIVAGCGAVCTSGRQSSSRSGRHTSLRLAFAGSGGAAGPAQGEGLGSAAGGTARSSRRWSWRGGDLVHVALRRGPGEVSGGVLEVAGMAEIRGRRGRHPGGGLADPQQLGRPARRPAVGRARRRRRFRRNRGRCRAAALPRPGNAEAPMYT